jgi:peptide deformylase
MKLILIPEDDPILATKTDILKTLPDKSVIDAMFELMQAEKGIGLAAPQVGLSQRFFIMANTNLKYEDRVFINPEIIKYSEEKKSFKEGCLSFRGQYRETNRPEKIQVKYTNMLGDTIERGFIGIWSICFQHELDHLNGITFNNY